MASKDVAMPPKTGHKIRGMAMPLTEYAPKL